ncbi:MAG: hypothetical protein IKE30_11250 [Clostridia bacterium]|nr:hypothetical protein [Clostridia bacterium]
MNSQSRRLALCSMMTALGILILMLGGVIPIMTFCSPAVASLTLLPILDGYGKKWALTVYAAISILGVLFAPDRESALLFLFLGYYPVAKVRLDAIPRKPVRVLAKLAVFAVSIGAMMLSMAYLFHMTEVFREYAEMSRALLILFVCAACVSLLLYDRLLIIMMYMYRRRLKRLFFH